MPRLKAARMTLRAADMVLSYDVEGDMPAAGTWMLSTTLVGGENGPIHQFGVKALDGRVISAFVFDHVKPHQYNFQHVTPSRLGERWTVVFPLEALDVAGSGEWKATLNVDGDDIGEVRGVL